MEQLKTEIRKIIAEQLLFWTLSILSDGEFKVEFADFLTKHLLKL